MVADLVPYYIGLGRVVAEAANLEQNLAVTAFVLKHPGEVPDHPALWRQTATPGAAMRLFAEAVRGLDDGDLKGRAKRLKRRVNASLNRRHRAAHSFVAFSTRKADEADPMVVIHPKSGEIRPADPDDLRNLRGELQGLTIECLRVQEEAKLAHADRSADPGAPQGYS